AVIDAFPDLKIFIRGLEWERNCRDKKILTRLNATPFYGKDFGNFFRNSRISLNVIDDTNYPAANMRFFEIPAAGGLQLSSVCPEMEQIFKSREHILYFSDTKELITQIDFALKNPEESRSIRERSHQFVKENHNYQNRLTKILNS
ncbi:MAG: glycosyltransferase, partial [Chitinophagaceae bacterium]